MAKVFQGYYRRFGDTGVRFFLFSFVFALNIALSFITGIYSDYSAELPVAVYAARFAGFGWGNISTLNTGFFMGIIYTPFFFFIENPYILYTTLIIINGFLISFISVIAYSIAKDFQVSGFWYPLIIGICCGFFPPYILASKSISGKSITYLIPWLVLWLIFKYINSSKKSVKIFTSLWAGIALVIGTTISSRFVTFIVIFSLVLILYKLLAKKNLLNNVVFFTSTLGGLVLYEVMFSLVSVKLFSGKLPNNSLILKLQTFATSIKHDGFSRFSTALFSNLYYFIFSFWGVCAIGLTLAFAVFSYYKRDGKKFLSPLDERIFIFAIFIASFLISSLISAIFDFIIKDVGVQPISANHLDGVIPLFITFTLIFINKHGFNLKRSFISTGVLIYFVISFLVTGFSWFANNKFLPDTSILGLIPQLVGANINQPLGRKSFLIISSCVIVVFAIIIAVTSCGKRNKGGIISAIFLALFMYSTVFTTSRIFPDITSLNQPILAQAEEISTMIYNESRSPKGIVYNLPSELAGYLQFLNKNIVVGYTGISDEIPVESIIITHKNQSVSDLSKGPVMKIKQQGDYAIFAYGNQAVTYAISKSNLENLPLENNQEDLPT